MASADTTTCPNLIKFILQEMNSHALQLEPTAESISILITEIEHDDTGHLGKENLFPIAGQQKIM